MRSEFYFFHGNSNSCGKILYTLDFDGFFPNDPHEKFNNSDTSFDDNSN